MPSAAIAVVDEVVTPQVREGLRWHRIVALYQRSDHPAPPSAALAGSYYAACTYGVWEFETDPRTNQLQPCERFDDASPQRDQVVPGRVSVAVRQSRRR